MKLSEFGKKPTKIRRNAPPIFLQNDASEKRYQAQIEDLNEQLGHYRTIEAERDDAMRRLTVSEENLSDTRLETSQLQEQIEVLQKEAQNRPEFEGRFFAKVQRDDVLQRNLLGTLGTVGT